MFSMVTETFGFFRALFGLRMACKQLASGLPIKTQKKKFMATVKLILDTRFKNENLINLSTGKDDNKYPLKIRVYQGKLYRDIHTSYMLKTTEWIDADKRISKNYPNSVRANFIISARFSVVTATLAQYEHEISKMDVSAIRTLLEQAIEIHEQQQLSKQIEHGSAVPPILETTVNRSRKELISLEEFGKKLMERKRKAKKHATAFWYECGITAIKKFNGDRDIMLPDITASFLADFEAHHISIGTKKNSISAYLRAVRAITNTAIKEILDGKRFEGYPWGVAYSIPSEKTKKRAVPKDVFNAVRTKVSYKKGSALWHAKNYMLMMFNCRGMNFIDLAKLKVENITDDNRLYYKRSKTETPISIGLTEEAKSILAHYLEDKKPGDYVFPIGYEASEKGFKNYSQTRKRHNQRFREIIKEATGTDMAFTSYVIRHSWASIAKKQGVPVPVISEGLGHGDFKTTQIYLDNFDNDVLDDANEMIVG